MSVRVALALGLLAAAAGCRKAPQIQVKLELACDSQDQSLMPIGDCSMMNLGCVNFLEFYAYQAEGDHPGNLIGGNCIPASQFGSPSDFCGLTGSGAPASLLPTIAEGQTVIFGMRALHAYDLDAACNDFLAKQQPVKVFYGLSNPVTLDSHDHDVVITIDQCASCAALEQNPGCDGGSCGCDGGACGACPLAAGLAPPAYDTTKYPGGAMCCPVSLTCAFLPGDKCLDGTKAELLPGGCCGVCPTATTPGSHHDMGVDAAHKDGAAANT